MDKKLSNKRKLNDNFAEQEGLKKLKPAPTLHSSIPIHSTELQLKTPHQQRCLNIQSGKVPLHNNTREEAGRSPKQLGATRPSHMRLDLELNLLPSEEVSNGGEDQKQSYDLLLNFGMKKEFEGNESKQINMSNDTAKISLSSSSNGPFEGGDHEKSEMVATVCKRCFMLVMLCKASPACPNCKFMHSPDQSAPFHFKKSFTQLLY